MKINIVYWSGTGNTEAMANLIKEGAQGKGAAVTLKNVSEASAADLNCDVLVLGCPSMGVETLEESEFEPYIQSIETQVTGKKIALFGSYGWGDGEWMREWSERMENAGATLAVESLIVNDAPSGGSADECRAFGALIAG
ncbi:MAG: flavodoxin [Clostridiales bacterium]|jgi:flavodoxin short chain|nr:flavodoxin [Clostridiales bacterium]